LYRKLTPSFTDTMPFHILDDNGDREGFFLIGEYPGSWDYQLASPLIQF
jgi:hypothetical protein